MTAVALLESLRAIGISVAAERGRLIVEGPVNGITSQLREELVRRKPELIPALEARQARLGDVKVIEARNAIAGLLAVAYQRHAAFQQVRAARDENTVDSGLASSSVASVHGGVP